MIKREDVKGTPFTIVTIEEDSFGCMGKYRITEPMPREELKAELEKITWDRIVQIILILKEI